ncbi:MAG: hypothetical protein IJH37_04140 [Clostridia bacterium]|nr:hypothetical protein [Clostridia bacterium]
MRSYTDPEMRVNVFDTESVVTQASGQPDNYADWKTKKEASEKEIQFNEFKQIINTNT